MNKSYVLLVETVNPDRLTPMGEGTWENVLSALTKFQIGRGERFSGSSYTPVQYKKLYDQMYQTHISEEYTLFNKYTTGIYTFVIIPQCIEMSKYRQ